ncbi:MAG: SMC-Scp complex subunit ScpB [Christensenellaceae bacterium]|nr:SMC-Scp complex subunit ScpB [Christensenellaceae bacterium]
MEQAKLFGAIESILYVSGEPISIVELQRVFDMTALEMRSTLGNMAQLIKEQQRGTRLFITEDTVQLVTNPEYDEWLVKLLAPPEERTLSDSMMETLSVIAYRQPVTRADIESVRGVKCDYSVSQLLKQGFIKELGRKDCVGRPMMFGTTDAFLRRFGLHSIEELPKLPDKTDAETEST